MSQLRMIFNADEHPLPDLKLAAGFIIRPLEDNELDAYNALRASVGFSQWTAERLASFRCKVLPDSLFVAVEEQTGILAASAAAESTDFAETPELGVLGWVMAHPRFNGQHLGRAVSIAAMRRLHQAGYRKFSLLTDDFRLAAVSTYLKLGWQPWLYADDMEERWRALAAQFNLSFDSLNCLPTI